MSLFVNELGENFDGGEFSNAKGKGKKKPAGKPAGKPARPAGKPAGKKPAAPSEQAPTKKIELTQKHGMSKGAKWGIGLGGAAVITTIVLLAWFKPWKKGGK